jgi:hypothetical protein
MDEVFKLTPYLPSPRKVTCRCQDDKGNKYFGDETLYGT